MSQQKILITGTNSGFGRLTALSLARKGHTVFATMRDVGGRNKAVAEEFRGIAAAEGLKLNVVEMEVTREESIAAAVSDVLKKAEYLDVLVNNAGFGAMGHAEAMTPTQLQELFDVNVLGAHRTMRAVLPSMRQRGKGLVVNLSSGLGRVVMPFMGAYCAVKAALEALTDAYRYETKMLGIEATIIEPGAFPTEFGTRVMLGKDMERAQGYGPMADGPQKMGAALQQVLSGPMAQNPQDVADTIVQLIESPAGSRPDRVVVDKLGGEGVPALNKAHLEVQRGMLGALGLGAVAG